VGHIGGSLSIIEVLTLLYYRHMRGDPANPRWAERDRLVLSKGHAGPALYSVLADKGFFPHAWLATLNQGGTNLPSHCDMNRTPGIDMTTGSLGQGFSAAVGIALALRQDTVDSRVYVIIGDGESNEGQIWEAALSAAHFGLSNIIAFTDYNKMQIDGLTGEIMDLEDLAEKWRAQRWFVQRVNGHSFEEMDTAVCSAKAEKDRPSMIICDTVKGKGAHFAEGLVANHNMQVDYRTAREAIALLEKGDS
jgi:transketolase